MQQDNYVEMQKKLNSQSDNSNEFLSKDTFAVYTASITKLFCFTTAYFKVFADSLDILTTLWANKWVFI